MKVSVVVPVYNVERYLCRCVDSILAQTFPDFELILIDDCSPDRSGEICDMYAARDSRVRVVHLPYNSGLFCVRAVGIDLAQGDWICFVDSDDYIVKGRLGALVDAGEESNADVVWGDVVTQDENSGKFNFHPFSDLLRRSEPIDGPVAIERMFALGGRDYEWHIVPAKIYRRNVTLRARKLYEGLSARLVMSEDVAWSVALMTGVKKMAFAHGEPYVYFRNANASTTSAVVGHDRLLKVAQDLNTSYEYAMRAARTAGCEERCLTSIRRWYSQYAICWRRLCVGRFPDAVDLLDRLIVKDRIRGVHSDAINVEVPASEIGNLPRLACRYRRIARVKQILRFCFYPIVVALRPIRRRLRGRC